MTIKRILSYVSDGLLWFIVSSIGPSLYGHRPDSTRGIGASINTAISAMLVTTALEIELQKKYQVWHEQSEEPFARWLTGGI